MGGSEDWKGQNPHPASRCTEARAFPKGRARGRPRGPAFRCLFLAPSPARALGRSGEVAWRGTRTAGPSQRVPGPGSHSPPVAPHHHRDIGSGQPPRIHTRGQEVFFPPSSPHGAAQAQGLLQPSESRRGRLLPPPPPPRERSPAFRVLGPRSQARPGPAQPPGPGVPGPPSLAPKPGSYLWPRRSGPGPTPGEPGVAGGRRRADG